MCVTNSRAATNKNKKGIVTNILRKERNGIIQSAQLKPQKTEKHGKTKTGKQNKGNKQKIVIIVVNINYISTISINYISNHFEHQQSKYID